MIKDLGISGWTDVGRRAGVTICNVNLKVGEQIIYRKRGNEHGTLVGSGR